MGSSARRPTFPGPRHYVTARRSSQTRFFSFPADLQPVWNDCSSTTHTTSQCLLCPHYLLTLFSSPLQGALSKNNRCLFRNDSLLQIRTNKETRANNQTMAPLGARRLSWGLHGDSKLGVFLRSIIDDFKGITESTEQEGDAGIRMASLLNQHRCL